MVQWEYKVVKSDASRTCAKEQEFLNEQGRDCWELVRIVVMEDIFVFYFKQPITLPALR